MLISLHRFEHLDASADEVAEHEGPSGLPEEPEGGLHRLGVAVDGVGRDGVDPCRKQLVHVRRQSDHDRTDRQDKPIQRHAS